MNRFRVFWKSRKKCDFKLNSSKWIFLEVRSLVACWCVSWRGEGGCTIQVGWRRSQKTVVFFPCLYTESKFWEGLLMSCAVKSSIKTGLKISLSLEIIHIDSQISFDKNLFFSRFKPEITSFWIWTLERGVFSQARGGERGKNGTGKNR